MRAWLWAPFVAFAGVLALAVWSLRAPADRIVHSRMVGEPMPALTLPALVPGKPGLAGHARGEPRLVNIFASWCIPCAAEAPQLLALKRQGVRIDAVAVRDTPHAVAAFLARYGDPYAAIGDDREARAQLALGSSGVPETFVVGADGRILLQHVGDIRADDVAALAAVVKSAR